MLKCGTDVGWVARTFSFFFFFDGAAIRAEAEHNKFKEGIETFNKEQLSHAPTVEKNTLPTKETIEQEKSA